MRTGQGRTESLEGLGNYQERQGRENVAALEDIIDFERVYRTMDAEDRRLLNLCIEGYSLKEIAERLGTSYSAAAVRLHRLRRRLRERRRLR